MAAKVNKLSSENMNCINCVVFFFKYIGLKKFCIAWLFTGKFYFDCTYFIVYRIKVNNNSIAYHWSRHDGTIRIGVWFWWSRDNVELEADTLHLQFSYPQTLTADKDLLLDDSRPEKSSVSGPDKIPLFSVHTVLFK